MLQKQKSDGTVVVIDRLFRTHNIVNMLCQPMFLIYIIFSFSLFPMVDYIGQPGCIFFSLLIQIFTSLYCLIFPLTIAVVRYVLVIHSSWANRFGVNKLVNIILTLSLIIPGVYFMNNILQLGSKKLDRSTINHTKRGRFLEQFSDFDSNIFPQLS
jgi:hypothetical protein